MGKIKKLDRRGIDFIKGFEEFRSKPYQCSAGKWTNGYGHTKGVTSETPPISLEQGEKNFQSDVAPCEAAVDRFTRVALSQNEFNALVSFAFNTGVEALRDSSLLQKLNTGNREAAAKEFMRWVYFKDPQTRELKISPGLSRRRREEMEMFLSGFSPESR